MLPVFEITNKSDRDMVAQVLQKYRSNADDTNRINNVERWEQFNSHKLKKVLLSGAVIECQLLHLEYSVCRCKQQENAQIEAILALSNL